MVHIHNNFGDFQVGQAVTYSSYPLVEKGLGMVTRKGVLTVGDTFMELCWDLTSKRLAYSDVCYWENLCDIKIRVQEEENGIQTNA